MKKIIAFASALLLVVASVHASSVSWAISDKIVGNMNYAIIDAASITALQNTTVYDSEDAYNTAIANKEGYSASGLASAVSAAGTVNGKGKASDSVDNVGASVTFIFWTGTPEDGGAFKYATVSTSGYTYDKPNTPPGQLPITGFQDGTFGVISYKTPGPVPEPCTVALVALGLAAFGLKRKVA